MTGDRVLLHGEAGEVEFVLDGDNNPENWPADVYGRGVMIAEPKVFGLLYLPEKDLADFEDLELISRSSSSAAALP